MSQNLEFGEVTTNVEIITGEHQISIGPASDPDQSAATFDLSADGCSIYTVFAAGYLPLEDEVRSRTVRRRHGAQRLGPADSVTVAERGVLLRPAAVREFDVVPTLPE